MFLQQDWLCSVNFPPSPELGEHGNAEKVTVTGRAVCVPVLKPLNNHRTNQRDKVEMWDQRPSGRVRKSKQPEEGERKREIIEMLILNPHYITENT